MKLLIQYLRNVIQSYEQDSPKLKNFLLVFSLGLILTIILGIPTLAFVYFGIFKQALFVVFLIFLFFILTLFLGLAGSAFLSKILK